MPEILEKGIVSHSDGRLADVRPLNLTPCERCDLCTRNSNHEIRMINRVGARSGDRVAFRLDLSDLNRRFILFFGIWLLFLLFGIFGGYLIGTLLKIQREWTSLLGGTIFLFLSFLALRPKMQNKEKMPEIIQVLKEESWPT